MKPRTQTLWMFLLPQALSLKILRLLLVTIVLQSMEVIKIILLFQARFLSRLFTLGVTNITLSNIICNGGHGFSVGSLGKGGKTETVKTVRVLDSVCNNCQNGVRIKTWPGGEGSVSDVKYSNVKLNNVDNPVIVTTHYCDKNQQSYCNGNDDSSLTISGVTFNKITG